MSRGMVVKLCGWGQDADAWVRGKVAEWGVRWLSAARAEGASQRHRPADAEGVGLAWLVSERAGEGA